MSQENVDIVRRVFNAFFGGWEDENAAEPFDQGLVAPDAEWRPVSGWPGERVYIGRKGWSEFMDAWTGEFDAFSVKLHRLVDAGKAVVAVVEQSATGKASGAPVDWLFAAVFEVEDGVVVRGHAYADPTEALEAAGLSE